MQIFKSAARQHKTTIGASTPMVASFNDYLTIMEVKC